MKTTVIVLAAAMSIFAVGARAADKQQDVRDTAAYEACLKDVAKEIQAEGGAVTNAIFNICDERLGA
jgi:hypothetical protein